MNTFRNIRDDGIQKVANEATRLALLPNNGDVVEQLDTNVLYAWNTNSQTWISEVTGINGLSGAVVLAAGSNVVLTPVGNTITISAADPGAGTVNLVGTIDSNTYNPNGMSISGSSIFAQTASATHVGLVNTGTQSFAGNKTFTGTIGASNLSGTNTGDVTIGTFGTTPDTKGATLSGQILTIQPADDTHSGAVSVLAQSFAGNKTFIGTITASNFSGSSSGSNTGDQTITLTSDVTGSGIGSFATTVAFVGTSSAVNIHTAELIANAATNANTASAVVRRDGSGNFSAGTITATLNGNASTTTLATDTKGLFFNLSTKTSNYSILTTDTVINADTTSGNVVLTLPTAIGNVGRAFYIKRVSMGAYAVTIATTGGQLIDGASTAILEFQYDAVTVISDGTGWGIY